MDDSGNVDLVANNSHTIRYGSITAVIMDNEYLDDRFNPAFHKLVTKHFGTKPDGSQQTVHRRVLNSPPDHGPYSVLKDDRKRKAWDDECLSMYERADYTVISACVDKIAWYYKYPNWEGDFYEVLVQAVLERAYYFLRKRGVAEVNIETKGDRDQRVKEQYKKALTDGYRFISADKLQSVFTSKEINILKKSDARPGAQLADLIAGPALQHIRYLHTGRHTITSPFTQKLVSILEEKKYYRELLKNPKGYGRVWRPD
jgi:hypothetical protein